MANTKIEVRRHIHISLEEDRWNALVSLCSWALSKLEPVQPGTMGESYKSIADEIVGLDEDLERKDEGAE